MKAIDNLSESVKRLKNPTVMGLDTAFEYLPGEFAKGAGDSAKSRAAAIFEYNKALIDGLADIVPCVKVQIAYYEQLGLAGVESFSKTLAYAKAKGYVTIADCKRNDIGSTAECYAKAYLSGEGDFSADFLTVNAYLGTDGVQPFLNEMKKSGKGIFVLVKTSNPSSGEVQDKLVEGRPLYEHMAGYAQGWGAEFIGECGYSSVGAVVGATYPAEGVKLRRAHKGMFFLVPGYGAQGAKAADLAGCFDENGGGAIVNASRSLICAHMKNASAGWLEAVRAEAVRMRDEITAAIGDRK